MRSRYLFVLFCFVLSLAPLGYGLSLDGDYALTLVIGIVCSGVVALLVATNLLVLRLAARPRAIACARAVSRVLFGMAEVPFVALGSGFFVLVAVVNGWRAFGHIPVVIDSVAHYIHAKFFMSGMAYGASPPGDAFKLEHFIDNGKFFSQYPPGHIAVLALGHLVGAPWLVDPLLGGLTCVALYLLARDLFSQRVARIALLLAVLSPFLRAMSSEFMNHATALFTLTLFSLCFFRAFRRRSVGYALVAGFAAGYCFITRPYTALLYVLPFAAYGAWLCIRDMKGQWARPLLMAIGFAVPAAAQLAYNQATTGSPWLFGYISLYGPNHAPWFHAVPEHFAVQLQRTDFTPADGMAKGFNDLALLQHVLFGWPLPSLVFVAAAFLLRRRRVVPQRAILLCGAVGVWLADATYFYGDWCFGPRYLYEGAALLIILTAYGMTQVPLLFRLWPVTRPFAREAKLWLPLAMAACSVMAFFSTDSTLVNTLYCWAPEAMVPRLEAKNAHHAVVFIDSGSNKNYDREYDELAAKYYPPEQGNDVIIARDFGDAADNKLMESYPGYTAYRWSFGRPEQKAVDRSQLGWFWSGRGDTLFMEQFMPLPEAKKPAEPKAARPR